MAKYNGRLNQIFLKMHFFVSTYDLEILEEYYKAQAEENGVSLDQFKKECAEIEKLDENFPKNKSKILDKLEQAKNNRQLFYALMYTQTKGRHKKSPNGVLIANSEKRFKDLIKRAKEYLKTKKQGAAS